MNRQNMSYQYTTRFEANILRQLLQYPSQLVSPQSLVPVILARLCRRRRSSRYTVLHGLCLCVYASCCCLATCVRNVMTKKPCGHRRVYYGAVQCLWSSFYTVTDVLHCRLLCVGNRRLYDLSFNIHEFNVELSLYS